MFFNLTNCCLLYHIRKDNYAEQKAFTRNGIYLIFPAVVREASYDGHKIQKYVQVMTPNGKLYWINSKIIWS